MNNEQLQKTSWQNLLQLIIVSAKSWVIQSTEASNQARTILTWFFNQQFPGNPTTYFYNLILNIQKIE